MAGLSLRCGDCGAHLKDLKEAQEHADITSHSNFAESIEAVLHLVCSTCGKPCRSKTESDLHTKRTGHAEFVDRTSEAAKPIHLEQPPPKKDGGGTAEGGTSREQPEDMVVPKVDEKLLQELVESMGFSQARATRALHFSDPNSITKGLMGREVKRPIMGLLLALLSEGASEVVNIFLIGVAKHARSICLGEPLSSKASGNSSIEGAVNWIVEHENDPDIEEMPLVSRTETEAEKSSLTPEEIKLKAQELRERARKKKEEDDKRMEREREKERIRIGKELLAAKKIEEENERKRLLALRKAEKEEEKRAREKIRQRLEEDKAERRRKLGLPPEDPQAAKPQEPAVQEKKSSLPIKPATKTEQMRDCLRSLKHNHKDDDAKVKRAFQTLVTYIANIAKNPNEEKFRKIRLSNPSFQERVGSLSGGIELLQLCGFEKLEGGEFIYLPRDKVDMAVLNAAGSELNSAISNPFFGVL